MESHDQKLPRVIWNLERQQELDYFIARHDKFVSIQ
jgi:hypothetical protein